jgi:diacylglycerol kinase (ATP)
LLEEANFRIHLVGLAVVLALGTWLKLAGTEWACIAISIAFVLMAEAFNTALERLADAVSPQRHPLVGAAKDVAATAVLLSAFGAMAVAGFLLLPKIWLRLH